jgi:hypothetical protein
MSKTTDTIQGLRFQVYPETKEVHVHDDQKNLKYIDTAKSFKRDVAGALKDFEKAPGSAIIEGTSKDRLCLMHDGKTLHVSIIGGQDYTKEVKDFLNKL